MFLYSYKNEFILIKKINIKEYIINNGRNKKTNY